MAIVFFPQFGPLCRSKNPCNTTSNCISTCDCIGYECHQCDEMHYGIRCEQRGRLKYRYFSVFCFLMEIVVDRALMSSLGLPLGLRSITLT